MLWTKVEKERLKRAYHARMSRAISGLEAMDISGLSFVLTIPTKPFFFLKELMRILQKTIRCAWLTPWLRA